MDWFKKREKPSWFGSISSSSRKFSSKTNPSGKGGVGAQRAGAAKGLIALAVGESGCGKISDSTELRRRGCDAQREANSDKIPDDGNRRRRGDDAEGKEVSEKLLLLFLI